MIVLVPVSRFRVRYEVAAGFPYSRLDRLVLRAVGKGSTSLDRLVETFQIHPRLLIQSLVTLTHTGWIALGSSKEEQFVLTLEGQQAVQEGKVPESTVISPRQTNVLFERVTGTVIPEGEALYVRKAVLQEEGLWAKCIRLKSEMMGNKLDEGQVQHLLSRRQGERLHWIGPIEMTSKGYHHIPMDVDLDTGRVLNLPTRCETHLKPLLLDKAREEAARREELDDLVVSWSSVTEALKEGLGWIPKTEPTPDLPNRDWVVSWSSNDLLHNPAQHVRLLNRVFTDAETSILIASGAVTAECLAQLKPAMVDALDRGMTVDLLWGYADSNDALKWMKKVAYDVRRDGLPGQLRFNLEPTSCNAKMILWDEGADSVKKGVVGTYDWLASGRQDDYDQHSLQFSAKTSHPAILSALCWYAAAVWSETCSGILSAARDRWRRVAASLEAQISDIHSCSGPVETDQVMMRVVLDHEHPAALREWTDSAQLRLLIASTKLDVAAKQRLLPIFSRSAEVGFNCKVLYGEAIPDAASVSELCSTHDCSASCLLSLAETRVNVLVSDLSACISSYSFLSQSSSGETGSRDVGLMVSGAEPSDQIAKYLNQFSSQV